MVARSPRESRSSAPVYPPHLAVAPCRRAQPKSRHREPQVTRFHWFAASLRLFALFFKLPPFVFNRLQPLFPKHPGVGYPPTCRPLNFQAFRGSNPPTFRLPHEPSPSTFVLRRIEPILYPQSYCPCAPLPATLQLRFRRLRFERVRTPHHPALSNAPSAYRPLDDGCRGWRNQHRIPRRQLPRGLLLPGQGREGGIGGRNPPHPAERNHTCRTRSGSLPRTRSAHRSARPGCHWRRGRHRALRIPARRGRQTIDFPRFLLAHCGGGQDKPGFLGPSAETPALFLRQSPIFISSNLEKYPQAPSITKNQAQTQGRQLRFSRSGVRLPLRGPVPRSRRFPQGFCETMKLLSRI